MKYKKIKLCGIFFSLLFCLVFFSGCFGKDIDGIWLSNVKYDKQYSQTINDQKMYNLVFSCTVKNKTKDTLKFTITYSAQKGVFLSSTYFSQEITLMPNEKKDLKWTMEKVQQAFNKDINIFNVEIVE